MNTWEVKSVEQPIVHCNLMPTNYYLFEKFHYIAWVKRWIMQSYRCLKKINIYLFNSWCYEFFQDIVMNEAIDVLKYIHFLRKWFSECKNIILYIEYIVQCKVKTRNCCFKNDIGRLNLSTKRCIEKTNAGIMNPLCTCWYCMDIFLF